MDGYKTLKAGQAVTFETIEGPKGLHATNIKASGQPQA
jgi:CspA family cold shock protein